MANRAGPAFLTRRHALGAFVVAMVVGTSCVRPPLERLPLVPAPIPPSSTLGGVTLAIGKPHVVVFGPGYRLRGRLIAYDAGTLTLQPDAAASGASVTLPERIILVVARPRGMSSGRRAWIGGILGGLAGQRFPIYLAGDMIFCGVLIGMSIARTTGTEQLEVLLDRRPPGTTDDGRLEGAEK